MAAVYHQLVDTYHSSESDIDVEENSEKPSTSRLRSSSSKRLRSQTFAQDWKTACRQLLETLWQCEDSVPFRYIFIFNSILESEIKNLVFHCKKNC